MPDSVRAFARRAIAYTLYYSGILWWLARRRLRGRAIALMYHRVLPANADSFSDEFIVVRPETFARHMAFLKRHFKPMSVANAATTLAAKAALPDMTCLVTFDDGWRDNFQHALPILRASGVPATVFVAVDYIGGENTFWQERLNRMMFAAARHGGAPRALIEPQVGADLQALDDAQLRLRTRAAVSRMKKLGLDEIAAFESRLRDALAAAGASLDGWGEDRFMDWREVAELTRDSPVSAAAHGCSHVPLTSLSPERLDAELTGARTRLGQALGGDVDAIAYPNGNYNETVLARSHAAGYRIGFSTDKGVIDPHDDALRLRRINIHESATRTNPEFLCAMLMIFHKLRRS